MVCNFVTLGKSGMAAFSQNSIMGDDLGMRFGPMQRVGSVHEPNPVVTQNPRYPRSNSSRPLVRPQSRPADP